MASEKLRFSLCFCSDDIILTYASAVYQCCSRRKHNLHLFFQFCREPFIIIIQAGDIFSHGMPDTCVSCRTRSTVLFVSVIADGNIRTGSRICTDSSGYLLPEWIISRTVIHNDNLYSVICLVKNTVYSPAYD